MFLGEGRWKAIWKSLGDEMKAKWIEMECY